MHNMWREQLISLIETGAYRTQGELVSALKSGGYDVNQASVSRELKAQDVHKRDGIYVLENGSLPANVPVTDAQATATRAGPTFLLWLYSAFYVWCPCPVLVDFVAKVNY